MRWTILIANLLTAGILFFVAIAFPGVQRTRVHSVFLNWKSNGALVEKPKYATGHPLDVEAEMQHVASFGGLILMLYLAGGACVANGIVFFFYSRRRLP